MSLRERKTENPASSPPQSGGGSGVVLTRCEDDIRFCGGATPFISSTWLAVARRIGMHQNWCKCLRGPHKSPHSLGRASARTGGWEALVTRPFLCRLVWVDFTGRLIYDSPLCQR